jgi:hypothetical protein
MVSNEDINKQLALKRKGQYTDVERDDLLETQHPFESVGDAYIFNFSPMTLDDLAVTIKNMFEIGGYKLEEGTPINGIYGIGNPILAILELQFIVKRRFTFKIEIYSDQGVTFLKISKQHSIIRLIIRRGYILWNMSYSIEFKRIINALKYLKPNNGYMCCDKCGGYYKLEPGEFQENFDRCQCGGELKYYPSIDEPDTESNRSNSSSLNKLLILSVLGLVTIYFITPLIFGNNSIGVYIVMILVLFLIISLLYTVYYFTRTMERLNQ